MAYLIDTNVLVRLANTDDALFGVAELAVQRLHRSGESLLVTAQTMIEFRSVATRPKSLNGLGLSVRDAEAKAAAFEATFSFLEEIPAIYPAWKAIVPPRQTFEHRTTIKLDLGSGQILFPLAAQEIPNADLRHVSTRVIRVAESEPMTCRTSD